MMSRIKIMTVLTSLSLCLACKPKEEEKEAEAELENLTETADIETANTVLADVAENMLPASLASSQSLRLDGGPCEGTAGFFDCQPRMLKLYLGISQQMVESINQIMASAGEGISAIGTGSGTITSESDDEGFTKVDYSIESESKYQLLFHTSSGPFIYLNVDGNVYEIKGAMANAPEEDGEEAGGGDVHTRVTYTDASNFEVEVKISNMPCSDGDVQAPGNFDIKIAKSDDIWQGKAMLYLPRWLVDNTATCDTEPTDASKLFLYTDFVGNDDNTTAALYMASANLSAATEMPDYAASNFCSIFPSACNNGYGFGDPNPVATYQNNFCVTEDDTEWGTSCTSDVAAIADAEFSDADEWLLPDDMEALAVAIPESL